MPVNPTYNASFEYDGKGLPVLIKSAEWGWKSSVLSSQNRKGSTRYPQGWHSQGEIALGGTCYSKREHETLIRFFREWHLYATSRSEPSFLRFRYPYRGWDYLLYVKSLSLPTTIEDIAPDWSLTFGIARDMLDESSGAPSGNNVSWWWNSSYGFTPYGREGLEDIGSVTSEDVMGSADKDGAFSFPTPHGHRGSGGGAG